MLNLGDYFELAKPRITFMVLITTAIGFYVGSKGHPDLWLFLHCLFGTALVSSAAGTMNQVLERETDGRMPRTAGRPLPTGRIHPSRAQLFAIVLGLCGSAYLATFVSWLACAVAIVTLLSYVFVYTPLKHKTPWALHIGAIPGALPPIIGWTAASGELGGVGWILFAILFLWQLPHFLAIGWTFRTHYARAGIPVLSTRDPDGSKSAYQSILYCLLLLPVSLTPSYCGMAGSVYLIGALALGLVYLHSCIGLLRIRTDAAARRLFRVSIIYLPLLFGLFLFDLQPL